MKFIVFVIVLVIVIVGLAFVGEFIGLRDKTWYMITIIVLGFLAAGWVWSKLEEYLD